MKKLIAILLLLATLSACSLAEPIETLAPEATAPAPLLVNADHPLPKDYKPADLVNLYEQKDRSFQLAESDIKVERQVFEAMNEMFKAANEDGVDGFIITSGYRSRKKQKRIYDESPKGIAAKPGTSEHESGLAFDVVAYGSEDFEKTAQFTWLQEHCWDFGFIIRYPKGKRTVTGIKYEPWHYRYVGAEVAQALKASEQTLEEYLGAYTAPADAS